MIKKFTILFLFVIFQYKIFATDFPNTEILTFTDSTSSGYIFFATVQKNICIMDHYGNIIQKNKLSKFGEGANLQLHDNGQYSFYSTPNQKFYILDSNLNYLDSLVCSQPARTDFHDFQILPNGNYVIFGGIVKFVNMSTIITGGKDNAQINGYEIQEFDKNKNVVFDWNSFDHIPITDATPDVDLTGNVIDYMHINSIMMDLDGNYIISSRHLDELTKISRVDGSIIWRMGGSLCKNNQFKFINDTNSYGFIGFSHQHHPIRNSNGNLMVFDNGNLKSPQFSRAVEYILDEKNKTVTKIWEYVRFDSTYTYASGNCFRLDNDNTLISWNNYITEVDKNGKIVYEVKVNDDFNYRSYKNPVFMDYSKLTINKKIQYDFSDAKNKTGVKLTIQSFNNTGKISVERHRYALPNQKIDTNQLINLLLPVRWVIKSKDLRTFTAKATISLANIQDYYSNDSLTVLVRRSENNGIFKPVSFTINKIANTIDFNIDGMAEIMIGVVNRITPPILQSPSNRQTGLPTTTTFTWSKVTGATTYFFKLSRDSNFTDIVVDTSTILNSYTVGKLENNKYYYWKMYSKNQVNTSLYSSFFTFKTKIVAPTIIKPIDEFYNPETDSLTWGQVYYAEQYTVQIADNPSFLNNPIFKENILGYSFQPNNIIGGKLYYWRVRAQNYEGTSEWSDIKTFNSFVTKPDLISPVDFSFNNFDKLTLVWKQISTDNKYQIQVSDDSKFKNLIYDNPGLDTNIFTIENLKTNTTYYWRVIIDDKLHKSVWSDTWRFVTKLPKPNLVEPTNYQVLDTNYCVLKWNKVKDATFYNLIYSESMDFSRANPEIPNIHDTSYTLAFLGAGKTFYWKVVAYNTLNSSDWSVIKNFFTNSKIKLTAPTLVSPVYLDYDLQEIETFSWTNNYDKNLGNLNFRLQITDTFDFSSLIIDTLISSNKFSNENMFVNGKKYFWRVMVIGENKYSDWSEIWWFKIREKLEIEHTLLISPFDKQVFSDSIEIKFKWITANSYNYYYFQISKDSLFSSFVNFKSIKDQSISINPKLLPYNSNLFWRVGLINNNDSVWSDTRNFYIKKDTVAGNVSVENQDDKQFEINGIGNNKYIINSKFDLQNTAFQISDIVGNIYQIGNIQYLNDNSLILSLDKLSDGVYFIILRNNNYLRFREIIISH